MPRQGRSWKAAMNSFWLLCHTNRKQRRYKCNPDIGFRPEGMERLGRTVKWMKRRWIIEGHSSEYAYWGRNRTQYHHSSPAEGIAFSRVVLTHDERVVLSPSPTPHNSPAVSFSAGTTPGGSTHNIMNYRTHQSLLQRTLGRLFIVIHPFQRRSGFCQLHSVDASLWQPTTRHKNYLGTSSRKAS